MSCSVSDHAKLVSALGLWLQESADFKNKPEDVEVRQVLKQAANRLLPMARRLKAAPGRFVLAVVGLTNVGKSTLLNALLGAELAPRRNGPCTASPIEFEHSDTFGIEYSSPDLPEPPVCPDAATVRRILTTLVSQKGPARLDGLSPVIVKAPIPLLSEGLVLADTPGFGAAQAGDGPDMHEQALRRYLASDGIQVMWVVRAEQGIGKRERDFFLSHFKNSCADVVVTGSEGWDTNNRSSFEEHFRAELSLARVRFHFVSGLLAKRGREAHDDRQLCEAGIPSLEGRIRELARLDCSESLLAISKSLGLYWRIRCRPLQGARPPLLKPFEPNEWREAPDCNGLKDRISKTLGVNSHEQER